MCVALLTYADLSARLDISREAARSLARRRHLPRSRSEDGKALVRVDFAELRYTPRPRRVRRADPIDVSLAKIEAIKIQAFKAEVARLEAVATAYRAVFERERERADRLAVELTQAAAETTAANAWAARLEDEVAVLQAGRRAGGTIAGQAALRLGHLAAAIVQADRAARR
ncbi:hypothetical protein IVB14_23735 [Bradyrhizobium sp. 180]|uniref:hypothetical protein n=1 Tax=unclassified Bradyrhizobium TaxID=2631580 RepID=UPI001FF9F0FF|nr:MULTISPECIES: hypothetical protein [unclassified Bradyrhizobium]MCK1419878.1 hypothetical protein [Bradyrhizobium sp. CW12]MCK1493349.1 hypothetical protein [Bradyrhizobium sp. 180]MCK1529549.1 hypothetical protein [Bradyrhizobium sp. 182]MCK1593708.1 hypothetical protein [Bradyrhizobium sp. 164]MCK1616977.1 hypothetical protein [Bradyrhizobium sp. 159]